MTWRIELLGKLPGLVVADGTVRRPPRLTQPWLLLARLAIPEIAVSEVPALPATQADAYVRPAMVAQVYRAASRRSHDAVLAARPDLREFEGARGALAASVIADLSMSGTGLSSVRLRLNTILAEAGHASVPGNRGPLALPAARTDVDAFFDLLAAGRYADAIDAVTTASSVRLILEGTEAPWLTPLRLLYARAVDGALAELTFDAEATERVDLLERAVAWTDLRMQLGSRMTRGRNADAQRYRALAAQRDGYLRRLRQLQFPAAAATLTRITLLCSRIADATAVSTTLGDAYGAVLVDHDRLLRVVWQAHGGVEVETEDATFLVAFADPSAAVHAAVAAQRVICSHPWPTGAEVQVRIAIHTGTPRVRDESYSGIDVHYATRLCAAAHGGQVLVSQSTAALVDIPLEDLGAHAVVDFPSARRVFHVVVDGRRRDSFPPLRTTRTGRTNLPNQLSRFVGRQLQLTELRECIPQARLVTLTGAGGVGKTRLAQQVAAELLDGSGSGVWFVDIAPLREPDLVPFTLADVLNVTVPPGSRALDAVTEALGERELLVVLDNCEHLLQAAADLVVGVLSRCAGVRVLATSREPLRIAGELLYRVPSLSTPPPDHDDPAELASSEAVQLLLDRAALQRRDFRLTAENARAIGRVCRRLDGVPLAIELAAVRLRTMSVEELDAGLDDRFALLTGGSRTALPRHQTLGQLIEWSYLLLPEHERAVLDHASVFAASGFDDAAATAICPIRHGQRRGVLDDLDALVDKNLIQAHESPGSVRYRLLETVRAFAHDKLTRRGDAEVAAACVAHREHYRMLAQTASPHLTGPDRLAWLERLTAEQDNLRAALDHCLTDPNAELGLRMATALARFWRARGHAAEGSRSLAQHLQRRDAVAATLPRGYALTAASSLLSGALADYGTAHTYAAEALSIARALEDQNLAAEALKFLAMAEFRQGDFAAAHRLSEEGIAVARGAGTDRLLMELLNVRGGALNNLDRSARASFEESLALARRIGDRNSIAAALNNLGAIDMSARDLATARIRLEEATELYRELGQQQHAANAATNLGFVCYLERDTAAAAGHFTTVLATAVRENAPDSLALALLGLALTATEPSTAATLHGAADAAMERIGYRLEAVEAAVRDGDRRRLANHLGATRFDAAHRAGQALPEQEAIALARSSGPNSARALGRDGAVA